MAYAVWQRPSDRRWQVSADGLPVDDFFDKTAADLFVGKMVDLDAGWPAGGGRQPAERTQRAAACCGRCRRAAADAIGRAYRARYGPGWGGERTEVA